MIYNISGTGNFDIQHDGSSAFYVKDGGNVGVGTTTPATNARVAIKDGHLQSQQTTAPTYTADAGAGTSPTISLSKATDIAGIINVTTGTAPSAWSVIATVNYNKTYSSAPIVVFSPINNKAASVSSTVMLFNFTTTGFSIYASTALTAATSYQWSYMVIETQ